MNDLLFVNGMLMRGFRLNRLLDGRATYVGRGRVHARLFDLGACPAAAADPDGVVAGEVYAVADAARWPVLDSAEGPQYHRGEVGVRTEDGGERVASMY